MTNEQGPMAIKARKTKRPCDGSDTYLGDHGVSRVGHNGADNACQVTGGERDAQLRALAVRRLGLREDVVVEHLHHLSTAEIAGQ